MRCVLPVISVCWALILGGGVASAQGNVGFPVGDVGQVLRQHEQPYTQWHIPPSPLQRLTKRSRAWIAAETQRQAQSPRDALLVFLDIEKTVGADVLRRAKRERVNSADLLNAVLFKIMMDGEAEVAKQAEAARGAGDAAVLAEAEARLAKSIANRKWAMELQSQTSLYFAAM